MDLCEIERMRAALARTPGLRTRLFTEDERAYCDRRTDPTERYAARFAAKEYVGCQRSFQTHEAPWLTHSALLDAKPQSLHPGP